MPKIKGDRNEDLVSRQGAPIRTQEDILRRVFIPRRHPLNAPDVTFDALPNVCVVVNVQWVSHVIGVLEALTQDDSWLGDEEEQYRAQGEAQNIIVSFMNGGACMIDPCCPDDGEKLQVLVDATTTVINNQNTLIDNSQTLIEYNQTQIIQNFISTYNTFKNENHELLIENEYVYDGSPSSISNRVPTSNFSNNDIEQNALCRACSQYLESVLYTASAGLVLATMATSATATVAAIALGIALAPVTAGASIVAGFAIGASILITGGTAAVASIISNTAAQRKVVCCMYASLKGQPLTFETFKSIALGCNDEEEENVATIAGWVNHHAQVESSYTGFLRLLAEAKDSGRWQDCDCCQIIEEYEIVSLNSAIVTKIDDFHYRIEQTEVDSHEDSGLCDDWHFYRAIIAESQGRAFNIIGGSGTTASDYTMIDANGNVLSGAGGAGGVGVWFNFRSKSCPPDLTTMDVTIEIACPVLPFVAV